MTEHAYVDGRCEICGDLAAHNVNKDRPCVRRPEPASRPIPASVVDDIYDRIQELRREKDAQLAEPTFTE
jgi:hypothetical protein